MPSVNHEGFGEAEATDQYALTPQVSSQSADIPANPANAPSVPVSTSNPTPRRRRGGRRVVRGAGAAGAALELTVQEHAAPLFEEPRVADIVAAEAASQTAHTTRENANADADDDEPISRRSSRRRPIADRHDASSASETADRDDEERTSRRVRSRRRSSFDDEYDNEPTGRRRASISDYEPFATHDDRDDDDRPSRRRRTRSVNEVDSNRARNVIDSLPIEPSSRSSRPMTSLLFQEPVLPTSDSRTNRRNDDRLEDTDTDDEMRDIEPTRSSRRSRRRRSTSTDLVVVSPDERDEQLTQTEQDEQAEPSKRSKSKAFASDHSAVEPDDAQSDDTSDGMQPDDTATSTRSRRSRRLNAQERRAAAEVEQIEEDLEFDDITYAPITEEDLSEGPTRSRRRRRRGNRDTAADAQSREDRAQSSMQSVQDIQPDDEAAAVVDELDADAADDSLRRHRMDEDGDESTVTRRRRRRRAKSADEAMEDLSPRRSRKQQYIDEITDIEGSTRLEAKKQRRRDNRRERSRQSTILEQDFLARRENVERLMVVRERGRHTQISVIEDNVLVEHYVSDIQEVATVGNVYLGRVQNVLPSMEAAFVDIGQARNGVLYAGEVNWDAAQLDGQPRRIELAFKSGDPVLVQVTKDPIGHKGARLTSQVTLAGRFLVLVPSGGMTGVSRKLSDRERSRLKTIVSKIAPKDMGVIIRTAAEGASEEAIVKDLESLVRQWERITAKRDEFLHGRRPKLLQGEPDVAIRVVRDIFNDDFQQMIVEGDKVYERIEEYLESMAPDLRSKLVKWDPAEHEGKDVFDRWQIDSQLRKGMERQVYLPSGGSIVIDRTEAMTTIDVNTGRFIGRGKSLEETVTRCNLEAAEEIARQLRLRDIGGMVMIDFVDMVMPANRDLVLRRLIECLARDRTKHQIAEVTSLGLVQMTRKRIGQGLVEAFSEECPTCKGRGFILHDEPTVNADYDDPYALKGGDPFIKTNKHGRGTDVQVPQGSSPDVKAKLAAIAAAAVAANSAD